MPPSVYQDIAGFYVTVHASPCLHLSESDDLRGVIDISQPKKGRHLLKYIRVLLKPVEPRRRNTRALISDQEALECMIQDSSHVRAIKTKGLSKITMTIVLVHTMTR